MHFKKGERIKHKDRSWECIVADDELAVFCPLKVKKDGYSRVFKGLFAVENQTPEKTGFKYKYIKITLSGVLAGRNGEVW